MSSSLIMYLGAYPQGKSCLNFRSGNSSKESNCCGQNMLIHIRCALSVRFDTCILYIVNEHLTKKGSEQKYTYIIIYRISFVCRNSKAFV